MFLERPIPIREVVKMTIARSVTSRLYSIIRNPGVKTIDDLEETTGRPKLSTPKNTLFRLL